MMIATLGVFLGILSTISPPPHLIMDANAPIRRVVDYFRFRNMTLREFRLPDSEPRWGPAIRSWRRKYLPQPGIADLHRKYVEEEIERLEGLAAVEVLLQFKRASRNVADNRKAEAIEDLKALRPRMRGSRASTDLEKYIRELDR